MKILSVVLMALLKAKCSRRCVTVDIEAYGKKSGGGIFVNTTSVKVS
jgi:hypothetical protein